MLFLFGTGSTHLTSKHFEQGTCSGCGQKGHIHCSIIGKYAHVFWIPFFPYEKEVIAQCHYCKRQYVLHEMPPEVQAEITQIKRATRHPFWHWLGLILAALFIASIIVTVIVTNKERNQNNSAYIANPQVADVYCYKYKEDNSSYNYSLMRIEAIRNDSLFFADNNYGCKYSSDVPKLNIESQYDTEELIVYTLDELKELLKSGDIVDIYRNLPILPEPTEQRGPAKISSKE